MNNVCGSCGSNRGHIEGRCRNCGGPFSPLPKAREVTIIEAEDPAVDGEPYAWFACEDRRRIHEAREAIDAMDPPVRWRIATFTLAAADDDAALSKFLQEVEGT